MHATTMHRAFLNALNGRNIGSPLGKLVVSTIQLHSDIQARQKRERDQREAQAKADAEKQKQRLSTSLDVV